MNLSSHINIAACGLALLVLLSSTGCVYSLVHREYPLTLRVVDEAGCGVGGVDVEVVRFVAREERIPHPTVQASTNNEGRADLTLTYETCDEAFLWITIVNRRLTGLTLKLEHGDQVREVGVNREFMAFETSDLGVLGLEGHR